MPLPDFTTPIAAVYTAGLVLYAIAFGFLVVAALAHLCQSGGTSKLRRCTVSGIFYLLVGIFLSGRISWTAVQLFSGESRQYLQFGLNVVSDCLFFSCFSLIVIHWAETNSKTTVGDVKLLSSVMSWVFLVINLVLYVFQTIVVVFVSVRDDSKSPLVLTSILVAVLENVVVGIAFLVFGLRLYCLIQGARASLIADPATLGQRNSVARTLLVTLAMTACFLTRSVLYIVHVVQTRNDKTGDDLMAVDSIPRLVLIFLSELAPIMYQLWLQRARKKLDEKHNRFIQDLYEQNSSETLHDVEPLLDSEPSDHLRGEALIN